MNSRFVKFFTRLLALPAAALIAALFGIVHDQLTFTLSPEYFTHFKFLQFDIPWAYAAPRVGAAYVGALATWWVGASVALLLMPFALRGADWQRRMFAAFGIVLFVTLLVGLSGLAYAGWQVDTQSVAAYAHWLPPGVSDPVSFVRVGFMHNASYLGGLVGLVAGAVYLHRAQNIQGRVVCVNTMKLNDRDYSRSN